MLFVLAPPPSGTASPAAPRTDRPPSFRRSLRLRLMVKRLRGLRRALPQAAPGSWYEGAGPPSTRRYPIGEDQDRCHLKCKPCVNPAASPGEQDPSQHPIEGDWSVNARVDRRGSVVAHDENRAGGNVDRPEV